MESTDIAKSKFIGHFQGIQEYFYRKGGYTPVGLLWVFFKDVKVREIKTIINNLREIHQI